MSWHLLAAVAAVATQMVTTAAPAQPVAVPAAETVPEVDVIQLENERYRRMTVPVTIGDDGPFRFMLDTGAQATVVSRDLADRLALIDRKPAILVGMASRMPVETAAIDDVRARQPVVLHPHRAGGRRRQHRRGRRHPRARQPAGPARAARLRQRADLGRRRRGARRQPRLRDRRQGARPARPADHHRGAARRDPGHRGGRQRRAEQHRQSRAASSASAAPGTSARAR